MLIVHCYFHVGRDGIHINRVHILIIYDNNRYINHLSHFNLQISLYHSLSKSQPICYQLTLDPKANVVVVTISIARGMEATTNTTVKDNASTTDVMCARCRYTTEQRVRETTTSAIMMSINIICRLLGSLSP